MKFHKAFTLLEMTIALGAGAAIILIAVAGFRSSSQVVRAARSLAEENNAIAMGVMQAFDELDFWRSYDDPDASVTATGLMNRGSLSASWVQDPEKIQPSSIPMSLPFTPFSQAWPSNVAGTVNGKNNFGRGWQENELLWVQTADNMASWWKGLGIIRNITKESYTTRNRPASAAAGNIPPEADSIRHLEPRGCWRYDRYGRYQILGLSAPPVSVGAGDHSRPIVIRAREIRGTENVYADLASGMTRREYGLSPGLWSGSDAKIGLADELSSRWKDMWACRTRNDGWLFDQMRGLRFALGDYGALDYLPVNCLSGCVTSNLDCGGVYSQQTDHQGRLMFGVLGWSWEAVLQLCQNQTGVVTTIACSANGAWDGGHYGLGMPYDFNLLTYYSGFSLVPARARRDVYAGTSMPDLERYYVNRHVVRMGLNIRTANAGTTAPYYGSSIAEYLRFKNGAWDVDDRNDSMDNDRMARMADYVGRTNSALALQGVRPRSWPDMVVSSARYLFRGRLNNVVKIGWVDAKGGEAELRFSGLGTTLRGARRQRQGVEALSVLGTTREPGDK